jgi:hypothetical protein
METVAFEVGGDDTMSSVEVTALAGIRNRRELDLTLRAGLIEFSPDVRATLQAIARWDGERWAAELGVGFDSDPEATVAAFGEMRLGRTGFLKARELNILKRQDPSRSLRNSGVRWAVASGIGRYAFWVPLKPGRLISGRDVTVDAFPLQSAESTCA